MCSAAARASGLPYEDFEARLQRLLTLLPFLQPRIPRMQPRLLAALAADPEGLASRLIQLKVLLPAADVGAIVTQRPSLLLLPEAAAAAATATSVILMAATPEAPAGSASETRSSSSSSSSGAGAASVVTSGGGEWAAVPGAVTALVELYGEHEAARMAQAEPQLLAVDVALVLQELGRYLSWSLEGVLQRGHSGVFQALSPLSSPAEVGVVLACL